MVRDQRYLRTSRRPVTIRTSRMMRKSSPAQRKSRTSASADSAPGSSSRGAQVDGQGQTLRHAQVRDLALVGQQEGQEVGAADGHVGGGHDGALRRQRLGGVQEGERRGRQGGQRGHAGQQAAGDQPAAGRDELRRVQDLAQRRPGPVLEQVRPVLQHPHAEHQPGAGDGEVAPVEDVPRLRLEQEERAQRAVEEGGQQAAQVGRGPACAAAARTPGRPGLRPASAGRRRSRWRRCRSPPG